MYVYIYIFHVYIYMYIYICIWIIYPTNGDFVGKLGRIFRIFRCPIDHLHLEGWQGALPKAQMWLHQTPSENLLDLVLSFRGLIGGACHLAISCASSVQTKAPIFKAWEPPYATYANDWYLKWWSTSTSYQRNVTSSGQLPDLVQSVKQQYVMIESDALCLVKPPRVLLVKRSVAGESWWNLC